MSIAEETRRILILEAFAKEANLLASEGRARLRKQAVEQLNSDGVAPSWTLPQIATVTLGTTTGGVYVDDDAKLTAWVQQIAPDQIRQVPEVSAEFMASLLKTVTVDGDLIVWPDTGEIVPGLKVKPAGEPKNLAIVPKPGVRGVLDSRVAEMLGTAHAAITGTPIETVDADADPFDLNPPTGSAA